MHIQSFDYHTMQVKPHTHKHTHTALGQSDGGENIPYISAFVSYRAPGEKELIGRRKRRNAENVLDVFHALARLHVEERLTLSGV